MLQQSQECGTKNDNNLTCGPCPPRTQTLDGLRTHAPGPTKPPQHLVQVGASPLLRPQEACRTRFRHQSPGGPRRMYAKRLHDDRVHLSANRRRVRGTRPTPRGLKARLGKSSMSEHRSSWGRGPGPLPLQRTGPVETPFGPSTAQGRTASSRTRRAASVADRTAQRLVDTAPAPADERGHTRRLPECQAAIGAMCGDFRRYGGLRRLVPWLRFPLRSCRSDRTGPRRFRGHGV
jgi:hypothetical protein